MPIGSIIRIFLQVPSTMHALSLTLGANVHLFKVDALIQDPVYLGKINRPLGATQMKTTGIQQLRTGLFHMIT